MRSTRRGTRLGFPISLRTSSRPSSTTLGRGTGQREHGTPDDPRVGPTTGGAPNQLTITFSQNVTGLATPTTYSPTATSTPTTPLRWSDLNRDIAFDNDKLVYDEFSRRTGRGLMPGAGRPGRLRPVAYAMRRRNRLLRRGRRRVVPIQVTVTSPGTGDSEVVTLTGSAPTSRARWARDRDGHGNNDGTLFVFQRDDQCHLHRLVAGG